MLEEAGYAQEGVNKVFTSFAERVREEGYRYPWRRGTFGKMGADRVFTKLTGEPTLPVLLRDE